MLDAINIISVFTSLLLERRVIFIADELSVLSSCVQAAVALLYPFSWQVLCRVSCACRYCSLSLSLLPLADALAARAPFVVREQHVYIPVLPSSLLTFCCAPMPFVVGILRSSVAELNKLSEAMEEVAIVDIDRNKFLSGSSLARLRLSTSRSRSLLACAYDRACVQ
jgi:hypothetical protein